MILTLSEIETKYKKELEKGTINTKETPYYNSLNQYVYMLEDLGFEVKK